MSSEQYLFIRPTTSSNKQEQQQEARNDGPLFTSVSMSSSTTNDRILFERSQSQDCFIGGDFWSTTFDNNTLAPPRSAERRHREESYTFQHRRHTWTSPASNSRLKWFPTPALKPVPPYYPLEKSAVTLHGISVEDVVNRASSFLRLNSISAVYHKHHAECRTSGFLKFVIQLWNGSESSCEETSGKGNVIVEVQRRQGSCLQMRKVRQGLIQAIQMGMDHATAFMFSDEHGESSSTFPPASMVWRRPLSARLLASMTERERPMNEWSCDPTDMTIKLLENRCVDQNQLGLESLVHLTDLSSAQQNHAYEVSMGLVCGEGRRGIRLRDAVVHYICNVEQGKDCESDDDDDDSMDDELRSDSSHTYDQGTQFGIMHNLVLNALKNALCTVSAMLHDDRNTIDHTDVEVDFRSCFWQWTVEAFVYNIEVADRRPQEAAKSTECLTLLFALAPGSMRSPIITHRLPRALCMANGIGKVCHFKLEQDSEQLMHSMGGVESM